MSNKVEVCTHKTEYNDSALQYSWNEGMGNCSANTSTSFRRALTFNEMFWSSKITFLKSTSFGPDTACASWANFKPEIKIIYVFIYIILYIY